MKTILLIFTLFISVYASAQYTCADATSIAISNNCEMRQYNFENNSNVIWLKFNASQSDFEFIIENSFQNSQWQLSNLELYVGICSSLLQLDSINLTSSADTINFDSLTVNQDYFLKIEKGDLTLNSITCCITPKGIGSYWHNNFTNSAGNSLLFCKTLLPIDWQFEPHGNQNCNEITVCINDELNLEIVPPMFLGNTPVFIPVAHQFAFVVQNGASYVTDVSALNTTLSFSNIGDVTFRIYPSSLTSAFGIIQNEPEFIFTVHVIDDAPQAIWDNNVICDNGIATLSTLDGSVFSNVAVDGVVFLSGNSEISFNSSNFSYGEHVVNYTLNGICGPTSYSTTFTIIEDNGFDFTIDNCGNAVFNYTMCNQNNSFNATLDFGDGTVITVPVLNGSATFTHQYANITPLNFNFSVNYYNGILFYSENGVINGLIPQNITLSFSGYLCEVTNITMAPSNFPQISWFTDPVLSINGQGTSSITPTAAWLNVGDITVNVWALDQNGCLFAGQKIIEQCCGPKNGVLPNTEFFERSYYVHTSNSGLSSSIPFGVTYYAPANVAINLPPPPVNSVSTPYSQPSTLTSLINAGVVSLTGGVLSIPATFYINNDLIIDQSVTLAPNNYVRIAPGRNIIINSGVTFIAANSTFATKCNEMWGGFIVNGTGSLIRFNRCNIVGAVSGIFSPNGGAIDILSCIFVDNLNGIVVTNNFSAALNKIVNTYFGDVPNQPLLAPYNSEVIPRTGIILRDVQQMIIGSNQLFSSSNLSSFGNLFHNMKIGIDGSRSTFQVYRNTFFKMTPEISQPAPNSGDIFCGVRAINTTTSIFPSTLTVGSTNTDFNIFHSCDFSISARNRVSLNARFNYIRNLRLRGISWEDNRGLTARIENNRVNSLNPNAWGIYVKNYPFGTANITSNLINTNITGGISTTFIPRFACGIYASTVTPTVPQTTNIEFNTVRNCLYGIWLLNISKAIVRNNNVNMNYLSSTVNQLSANFAPIRGIVVQNGSENNISSNTVTWSSGVGNNVSNNNLQGIRIENSPASKVKFNVMSNTAVGLYARGSSMGSKVECNTMNFTNNGFYMDYADISNQGYGLNQGSFPGGESAQNVWNNTFSARTDGTTINHSIVPLKYNHSLGLQFNSFPSVIIDGQPNNWDDVPLTSPRSACVSSLLTAIGLQAERVEQRKFEMLGVVKDSLFEDTIAPAMKHFLNQSVLNRLKLQPDLLSLSSIDDYIYQNYLDSMQSSAFYKIIRSQQVIANKEFDSSSILINSIDGSDYFNDLIKKVQTVWNNSLVVEIPISSADSSYLYEVACLDPLKHGAGVYIARSILDYDGWCYLNDNGLKSMQIEADEQSDAQIFTVAPNPSDGNFQVSSTLEMQEIKLIDLSGKLIETLNMNTNNQTLRYNVHSGLYILLIQFSDGSSKTEKIQIQ